MNPVYTRKQLESKKLSKLKAIALQLGVTPDGDKRVAANWVEVILSAQPQPIKEFAESTCADCPHFQSHNDGTDKGWCCLFDRFARDRHEMTQDCINSFEVEQVDDYLFHGEVQPANLPVVGQTHFIGDRLLRCIQVGGDEYAAVWDVRDENLSVGKISMNWGCPWVNNLGIKSFTTPQEAVIDLCQTTATKKTEIMKTKIIYHQVKPGVDCADGIAACWVAYKAFPDADIEGCAYQGELPDIEGCDRLVIVDFSFPAQVLEEWAATKVVIVIDHHKTAMNDLAGVSDRVLQRFEMSECGATLSWQYFFPDAPVPAFLSYVKDRDLWNFDLPYSEEMHEAITSLKYQSMPSIDKRQHTDAHKIVVVEVPEKESRLISDLCSHLYKNNPDSAFVVAYYYSEADINLSFRSDKKGGNFDVSAIAKSLGGGGHHNAAGAIVSSPPWN